MMGPAEEDAERAGGSDTSLPGRRALQPPFPEGTAVRRPGLCRALELRGSSAHEPIRAGCVWPGCKSGLSCQTGGYELFTSHSDVVRPDQTESVWCEVT